MLKAEACITKCFVTLDNAIYKCASCTYAKAFVVIYGYRVEYEHINIFTHQLNAAILVAMNLGADDLRVCDGVKENAVGCAICGCVEDVAIFDYYVGC